MRFRRHLRPTLPPLIRKKRKKIVRCWNGMDEKNWNGKEIDERRLTWPIMTPVSAAASTLNEYRLLGWKTGLLSLTSVRWTSIWAKDSLFKKTRLGRSSSAITRIVNSSVASLSSGTGSTTLSQPVSGPILKAPLESISPYLNLPFSPYFRWRKKKNQQLVWIRLRDQWLF